VRALLGAFVCVGILAAAFTLGLISPRPTQTSATAVAPTPPPCEYVDLGSQTIHPPGCRLYLTRPDAGS
jgi:hypothetical protein